MPAKIRRSTLRKDTALYIGASFCALMWGKSLIYTVGKVLALYCGHLFALYC
jgi:hypothetical protein